LSYADFESNTFQQVFLKISTINITLCTKLVLIFYFENIIKPCNKTTQLYKNCCWQQMLQTKLVGVFNISFHCTKTLIYTTIDKSLLHLSFIFSGMITLFFPMRWHMSILAFSPFSWHYGILGFYYPTSSILWLPPFESLVV